MKQLRFVLLAALAVVAARRPAAVVADSYEIRWYAIEGGGVMWSTGGPYDLGGTIGQPDAGGLAYDGTIRLIEGFWSGTPIWTNGDLNCDGVVDAADIDPFFVALGSPPEYAQQFPYCTILTGDANGDGVLDAADIDAFFDLLQGS